MSHDVHQRVAANRRRLTRNTLRAATGATALAVAAGLIAHAHGQATRQANDTASHQSVAPAAVATATATQGSPLRRPAVLAGSTSTDAFVPPSRRVVLPSGAAHVDGYPVRFPHSPEGAAAVVAAMTTYSTTMDYAAADEVLHLYADPSMGGQISQMASRAVAAVRTAMMVSPTGSPPGGFSVVTRPVGVQWRQVSPDVWDISLLSDIEFKRADHQRADVFGATRAKWFPDSGPNGGDWKVVATPDLTAPQGGEVGTKAFNDAGYVAIEQFQP